MSQTSVGCLYLLTSSVVLLIDVVLLSTLHSVKEYSKGSYTVIKHLCLADTFQAVVFVIGGAMTVAHSGTFPAVFEKICGSLIISSWFLHVALSTTLAIDRLLIFIIGPRRKLYIKIKNMMISTSWLIFALYFIGFLSPFLNFGYSGTGSHLVWYYESDLGSQIAAKAEWFIDLSTIIFSLLLYLATAGYILKIRVTITNATFNKAESIILKISFSAFFYEMCFTSWYFFGMHVLNDERTYFVISNMLWILECALTSTMTFLMNRQLRKDARNMLRIKRFGSNVVSFNVK
ncbi:hypothetical protein QR680_015409 [Steinernema hermaphroditum]|uniref:Uncharacterized protein n=1 Tax=Steinernema hermaphroditum TaxID=289476 RepID=A0AA39H7J9_9BILA|nr:hypothetical protein QR680_015409 [Steinernema hermaphroditum]